MGVFQNPPIFGNPLKYLSLSGGVTGHREPLQTRQFLYPLNPPAVSKMSASLPVKTPRPWLGLL